MDKFNIDDYIDYEESHDDQENGFSYAETYGEECFHIVQSDINFQGENSLSRTESHEEVRESPPRLCVGMTFKHWDYAYLVLMAYGQRTGVTENQLRQAALALLICVGHLMHQ
ncbi:2984_t:CDS:2, partial [Gigaspora rosea]